MDVHIKLLIREFIKSPPSLSLDKVRVDTAAARVAAEAPWAHSLRDAERSRPRLRTSLTTPCAHVRPARARAGGGDAVLDARGLRLDAELMRTAQGLDGADAEEDRGRAQIVDDLARERLRDSAGGGAPDAGSRAHARP